MAGMPRQAPASKLALSGNGTACSAGSTMYSAAVPNGRFHCPFQIQTRSPMRDAGNAVADRVDLAGAVAVRDHARKRDLADGPRALHVGRIDARGLEAGRAPRRGRAGRFDLAHAQHVAGRPIGSRNRQRACSGSLMTGSIHRARGVRGNRAKRPGFRCRNPRRCRSPCHNSRS